MRVDLKFIQEERAAFRIYGVSYLNPATVEALFAVAELSLGGGEPRDSDEEVEAPAEKPVRKPRIKQAE